MPSNAGARLAAIPAAVRVALVAVEPDVTGAVNKPVKNYGPGCFDLAGWQIIGGYAIQPRWGDGHNTGLYTYAFLRSLS